MTRIGLVFVGLTAVLHLYIAWFEIFAWTTRGPEIFSTFPVDLFEPTIAMAANQGIYNAFLAVGLLWSLVIGDAKWQFNVAICFMGFVFAAGVMAAATVAFSSGLPQMVPAAIGLACLLFGRMRGGEVRNS